MAKQINIFTSANRFKTINGQPIIGSGNIEVGGGGGTVDPALSPTSTNPVQNKVVTAALNDKQDKLESGVNIKTIGGESVLGAGNITRIPLADNLYSADSQTDTSSFIVRTSGGDVSIETGEATLVRMRGRSTTPIHTPETLTYNYSAVQPLTGTIDLATWLTSPLATESGRYYFYYNETETSWQQAETNVDLATYGISISGTPIEGDTLVADFTLDSEDPTQSTISLEINAVQRVSMELDKPTWRSYVNANGTYTFSYDGVDWTLNATTVDLADYGITLTGTATSGDSIVVDYVALDFGIIYNATPTSFKSIGFNLYNYAAGWARVVGNESGQWYNVEGTYTKIEFSTELAGVYEEITPQTYTIGAYTANNAFPIYQDGYIKVTGGNDTDTMINLIWSGYMIGSAYQAYKESVINVPTVDINGQALPSEICRVGTTYDEISFDLDIWTKRIGKVAYDAATLAALLESNPTWEEGVDYEWDNNYIYFVLTNPTVYNLSTSITGIYEVDDFGIEEINGTSVAVEIGILYGQNLKDKLRRDVLTIGRQVLSPEEQAQVWENLGIDNISGIGF